ncbi:hypothetical protein EDB19DRAFT_989020 [Suillus lakei]|nr:hypothetical protein EDB19DRAFT_989020 [Suillus lakei]
MTEGLILDYRMVSYQYYHNRPAGLLGCQLATFHRPKLPCQETKHSSYTRWSLPAQCATYSSPEFSAALEAFHHIRDREQGARGAHRCPDCYFWQATCCRNSCHAQVIVHRLSRGDHCFVNIALTPEYAQYDSHWSSTGPESYTPGCVSSRNDVRINVSLALASFVLGAAIPAATVTMMPTAAATSTTYADPNHKGAIGALWKNNVHDKVYSSEVPAATPTTEGEFAPLRRSGELWKGREHEEVDPVMGPFRRSGELWRGIEHEEVAPVGRAPSRRSGELWRGLEHEEISASP